MFFSDETLIRNQFFGVNLLIIFDQILVEYFCDTKSSDVNARISSTLGDVTLSVNFNGIHRLFS